MDIHSILFKLGVVTFVQDIETAFPATASATQQIGNQMPTDIGYIYGLSTYADGVDAANRTLPSTVQCQGLYLTLQDGATQFYVQIRMSDLLNEFAGSPLVRTENYRPVNIPYFDLSKSFYSNPLLVTSVTVHLKLHYIQLRDWEKLKVSMPFLSDRPSK